MRSDPQIDIVLAERLQKRSGAGRKRGGRGRRRPVYPSAPEIEADCAGGGQTRRKPKQPSLSDSILKHLYRLYVAALLVRRLGTDPVVQGLACR
jgi:hypothetical protein